MAARELLGSTGRYGVATTVMWRRWELEGGLGGLILLFFPTDCGTRRASRAAAAAAAAYGQAVILCATTSAPIRILSTRKQHAQIETARESKKLQRYSLANCVDVIGVGSFRRLFMTQPLRADGTNCSCSKTYITTRVANIEKRIIDEK